MTSVAQDGKALIKLEADRKTGLARSMQVNGVKFSFSTTTAKIVLLPNKLGDSAKDIKRVVLASFQGGRLAPVRLSYDPYGFLAEIKRDKLVEKIEVQHETLAERLAWLNKIDALRKAKKNTSRLSAAT